ncbi:MAG TPA: DegQ family serine endoprotease [Azospirillaceae bacterium]|nr:DegQ family serine endoprotease [Azospirillaceae bacterium]
MTAPKSPARRAAAIAAVALCLGTTGWAPTLAQQLAPTQGQGTPSSFSQLAQAKLPAVVTITASSAGPRALAPGGGPGPESEPGPRSPFPPGSPFNDFFEDFFGRRGGPGGPPPGGPGAPGGPGGPGGRGGVSLGSGFVVDPAGYIVTNNHVVEGASEIRVTLHDEREFPARLVGTDPATDLALLKIEAQGLPTLDWGNSDQAQIGDWVMAIGNPFGLGGTVTVGIISARAREIGAGPYDAFIQTDAAINSGNSGGPLIALDGRVIGVNTAIFSRTGGNIGIGFAVPASIAQPVIAQLRENGAVTRGFLGVSIQPVTPDIAEALGLKERRGALVASVQPNGPAAGAGIQPGDVITSFNGQPVNAPRELSRAVAQTGVGSTATVELLRNGRAQTVQVQVAKLEPQQTRTAAAAPSQQPGNLGMTLAPVSPANRERFQIPPNVEGVVVMSIAPGSPAAERGLQPGDVIKRVGQQPVDDPQDVADAVRQAREERRDSVLVLVQRRDSALFVPLPVAGRQG